MRPIVFLSNAREQCATFFWRQNPVYYVGYRFVEHEPQTSRAPLAGIDRLPGCRPNERPRPTLPGRGPADELPDHSEWVTRYAESDPADPIQLSFQAYPDGTAWARAQDKAGAQSREFFFQPVEDGAWMWMTLTTRVPIEGAFCVQQCLRLTGAFNAEWRRAVAHVPFLSELDMQALGNPNGTLTYARRGGQWVNFPVQHTVGRTPVGRPGTDATDALEIDHGLIVRETVDRRLAPPAYWDLVAPGQPWDRITAGMYWERTANVSNRHPADCLHAAVDFGPLAAGQSRTVHGRFYFVEGNKDDLLELWRRDFSERNADR